MSMLGRNPENGPPQGMNHDGDERRVSREFVQQEMDNLKKFKRLSIGQISSILDPDLPTEQVYSTRETKPYKGEDNTLWVPASVHPEVSPNEWKSFVSSRKRDSTGSRLSQIIDDEVDFRDASAVLERKRQSQDMSTKRQSILELSEFEFDMEKPIVQDSGVSLRRSGASRRRPRVRPERTLSGSRARANSTAAATAPALTQQEQEQRLAARSSSLGSKRPTNRGETHLEGIQLHDEQEKELPRRPSERGWRGADSLSSDEVERRNWDRVENEHNEFTDVKSDKKLPPAPVEQSHQPHNILLHGTSIADSHPLPPKPVSPPTQSSQGTSTPSNHTQATTGAPTLPSRKPSITVDTGSSEKEQKGFWRWRKGDNAQAATSPTVKSFSNLFKRKKDREPVTPTESQHPTTSTPATPVSPPRKEVTPPPAPVHEHSIAPISPQSPPSPVSPVQKKEQPQQILPAQQYQQPQQNKQSQQSSQHHTQHSTHRVRSPSPTEVTVPAPVKKSGHQRTPSQSYSRHEAAEVQSRAKEHRRTPEPPSTSEVAVADPDTPEQESEYGQEVAEQADKIQLPYAIPAHQVSDRSYVMMYHRFPLHIERAIYRFSHMKLANPKRPLREQVLLSNFMYAYLNLINQGYQQQMEQQALQGGYEGEAETPEIQSRQTSRRYHRSKRAAEKLAVVEGDTGHDPNEYGYQDYEFEFYQQQHHAESSSSSSSEGEDENEYEDEMWDREKVYQKERLLGN